MRTLQLYYLNNRLIDKEDIPSNSTFIKRIKRREWPNCSQRKGIIIEKYYTNQKQ